MCEIRAVETPKSMTKSKYYIFLGKNIWQIKKSLNESYKS